MYIEDLSDNGRTRFRGYFLDNRDTVFIKGLSVRSSLFAQKMSSSVVELGFLDYFFVRGS